ncbi:hypothetical protein FDH96_gp106 [Mycobacterium phage Rey]|uniref:Uncharacterized protein n=1 Tax=Mycobacterium phage Rey TaxID=1034115 RepID=G1D5L3_9CAUD|nr:hypothetical protein FDH96_gp106 [Mycobacterium phage Rey]AEK10061.1 hypothetical protein PBI_REY_173 [Mycobacterium phage Rey]
MCDCLTAYDSTLPHAATCELGGGIATDPIRELAEMASYRDIDAALMAYHAAKRG